MAQGRLVRVRFDKTEEGNFGIVDEAPYKYQPFPRAVYHDKEAPRVVESQEALAKAVKAGWKETPIRPQDSDTRPAPPEF